MADDSKTEDKDAQAIASICSLLALPFAILSDLTRVWPDISAAIAASGQEPSDHGGEGQ